MNVLFLLVIATLDLAGMYFGIRMLLSSFKDKTKYPLLQRYRLITITQFVCQLTIQATNTVKASKVYKLGIDFQSEEPSCSPIDLVSISAIFFLICNFIAMAVVHWHPTVLNSDRAEPSPSLVMNSVLAVGFPTSVVISWLICFCQDCVFYAVFKVFVLLSSFLAVAFVAWRSCKHIRNLEHNVPKASPKTPHLGFCCDKKTTFYTVCYAIMLIILCLYCHQRFEKTAQLYEEALYLLAVNYIVGILFPASFKDLIDSNYVEQNCEEPAVQMAGSESAGLC